MDQNSFIIIELVDSGKDIRDISRYPLKRFDTSLEFTKNSLEAGESFLEACEDVFIAERRRREIIYERVMQLILDSLGNNTLPRKSIRPIVDGILLSNNPLRFKEKNCGAITALEVLEKGGNVIKAITLIKIAIDNLEHLYGISEIIQITSEYSKKLIGKYIIIELCNIYVLLKYLASNNENYEKEFMDYSKLISELESEYHFQEIRNTISAHLGEKGDFDLVKFVNSWDIINKESIERYCNLTYDHIIKVIPKYYPVSSLIFSNEYRLQNSIEYPNNKGFIPFDAYEI